MALIFKLCKPRLHLAGSVYTDSEKHRLQHWLRLTNEHKANVELWDVFCFFFVFFKKTSPLPVRNFLRLFKLGFIRRKWNMRDIYFTNAVQNAGLIHQVFVRWKKGLFIQQKSLCRLGRILYTHKHTHKKAVNFQLINYSGCRYPYNGWRSVKHSMAML